MKKKKKRMVKIDTDCKQNNIEEFRLNISNRLTVSELLKLSPPLPISTDLYKVGRVSSRNLYLSLFCSRNSGAIISSSLST